VRAFAREPIEIIPEWLAATRDVEIATGLSCEEALLRASKLRHLIREGRVSPKDVELDEEGKDVLHALVKLISETATKQGEGVAREAERIHGFLREIDWPADGFAEKADLLRRCAIAGWSERGVELDEIAKYRHDSVCAPDPDCLALGEGFLESITRGAAVEEAVETKTLFSAAASLRARADDEPLQTLKKAAALHQWLSARSQAVGSLDEADLLLGIAALWAGTTLRISGHFQQANRWFDLAQERFLRVVNSAQQFAKLDYARATVLYQQSRCAELVPIFKALRSRFEKLGMPNDAARAGFTEAMTLASLNRWGEALEILEVLSESSVVLADGNLHAVVQVYLATSLAQLRERDRAEAAYATALRSVASGRHPIVAACLKWSIGDFYRSLGDAARALYFYRLVLTDYLSIGLRTLAAQIRLTIADVSLELGRDREAEQEIVWALPILEEEGLVGEGLAAVSLLKESVRRRKTDPRALRELREHLRSNT